MEKEDWMKTTRVVYKFYTTDTSVSFIKVSAYTV